MASDLSDEYRAIYGTPDGYVLICHTGPYYVEEAPDGSHVISRRLGKPDMMYERLPLTAAHIETLRACYLDGQGNNPNPEVIAYFDRKLGELKPIG